MDSKVQKGDLVINEANLIHICNKRVRIESFLSPVISLGWRNDRFSDTKSMSTEISFSHDAFVISLMSTPRTRQEDEQEEESKHDKAISRKCIR